jgi:UDP-N-acetylmuramate--alanine ligase
MGVHAHFIGIGGYGMSALAEWLRRSGATVSGCDARPNARTRRLTALGVDVREGHDPAHLAGVDEVVFSTDVPDDLPELAAARASAARVLHRSELLARALEGRFAVAVTGTHGKTTTTALTAHLLEAAGRDPLALVGAEVEAWGGGLRPGAGDVAVVEADESDGSFLRYHPDVAVVTNVEAEHLEHYGGRFERVLEAYAAFLSGLRPGGRAVLWAGDPRLVELGRRWGGEVRLYGEEKEAHVRAEDVAAAPGGGSAFTLWRDGRPMGRVRIAIPGRHNVHNALAAAEAALLAGAGWEAVAAALPAFANAHRRFEVLYRGAAGLVVDDYAHHPSEIRAVLAAARSLAPGRVCAIFQPQRYVRTKNLWDDFVTAFDTCDEALLLDVYAPAGERPLPGVGGAELARAVAARTGRARYAPSLTAAVDMARASWVPGDLWLTLGAGDVWRAGRELAARLAGDGGRVAKSGA